MTLTHLYHRRTTDMVLPSFNISSAGIQGQWLVFTLGIDTTTQLHLQDTFVVLGRLGRQELPQNITVLPETGFATEMRFLLPPVSTHFPHFESNTLHAHATRLDKVLWLTEQAEHHGKVVFRLREDWYEVSVIVRV